MQPMPLCAFCNWITQPGDVHCSSCGTTIGVVDLPPPARRKVAMDLRAIDRVRTLSSRRTEDVGRHQLDIPDILDNEAPSRE